MDDFEINAVDDILRFLPREPLFCISMPLPQPAEDIMNQLYWMTHNSIEGEMERQHKMMH